MEKSKKLNGKKKRIIIGGVVCFLFLLLFFLLVKKEETISGTPVLTIEMPQKISRSDTEEFTLDVSVSHFGDARYPAASFSISFDKNRLEFLGVEEGNVFVHSDGGEDECKLPEWGYNLKQSNEIGKINLMYLDTTGGRNAFSKELLEAEDNVVFRLKFRLRGSVREGDICDLIVEDAVFAASEEEDSLAMTQDTLKVKNSKIVVGE